MEAPVGFDVFDINLRKTNIFQVSSLWKSLKNSTKINANAERGDKSAKLVVKVDLEGSSPAFGKDLGSSGPPSWSQVDPSWPMLASSGCSWAPFGRILVPKSCQNGPQGAPRRLQEWVFGRILVDFLVDFAHIYRQVSRYERHSKSMMILIKIYCQIKIHDQRGNQVERRTRGGIC